MLKKFTFFVDTGVPVALDGQTIEHCVGYRTAIALVAEIRRYAALLEAYQPAEFITDDDDPPTAFNQLMNPAHRHKRSENICKVFKRAFRIECVLQMLDRDAFSLQLSAFEKRKKDPLMRLSFTIGVLHADVGYAGGVMNV